MAKRIRRPSDPLLVVEKFLNKESLPYERKGDEIELEIDGIESYTFFITWLPPAEGVEAMHFCCMMTLKTPEAYFEAADELVALINRHIWIGSFNFVGNEERPELSQVLMRYGLMLPEESFFKATQVNAIFGWLVRTFSGCIPGFLSVTEGQTAKNAFLLVDLPQR